MDTIKRFYTLKRLLVAVGIIFLIVFAFINFSDVEINFLFFKVRIPMFYEIIGVGLIGFICGYFVKGWR
ncbi:MAG: hypothetical protein ACK5MW_05665 [Enterococcus sp.]